MEYHIRTLEQLRPILVGLRKQAGLSQVAVASLLGVSQQSYAKIEANPSATSVERLFKILGLLGADIILGERKGEATDPISASQGADDSDVSSSRRAALHPVKKDGKRTPRAPAKLVPPSKKTENW